MCRRDCLGLFRRSPLRWEQPRRRRRTSWTSTYARRRRRRRHLQAARPARPARSSIREAIHITSQQAKNTREQQERPTARGTVSGQRGAEAPRSFFVCHLGVLCSGPQKKGDLQQLICRFISGNLQKQNSNLQGRPSLHRNPTYMYVDLAMYFATKPFPFVFYLPELRRSTPSPFLAAMP